MSKITLDNLSDNLKAYLEGLGLSEEQVLNLINENGLDEEELKAMLKDTMSINELSTNSKTVIGAINELFQNANNGKQLIANAIGEPLNVEDTFSAMSSDINSLLSQFKTNMMNNGVTVESGDKFKSLIDKIATMVEEGGGKGIQFAEGIETIIVDYTGGGDFRQPNAWEPVKQISINVGFKPMYVLLVSEEFQFCQYEGTDYSIPQGYFELNNMSYCDINYTEYGGKMVRDAYWYKDGTSDGSEFIFDRRTEINNTGFDLFYRFLHVWSGYAIQNLHANVPLKWIAIGVGEEDTTLRDSLASILEGEGVSVTEDDDMASLIGKVDSEFDKQVVPEGTAVASNVDKGKTFINSTGQLVTGTSTKVSPAGTAVAANVLSGKTFINSTGSTITGTMTDRGGAQTVTPGTSNKTLNSGYYSGNITVKGDSNLVASNIVSGKSIFGVNGTAKTGGMQFATGTFDYVSSVSSITVTTNLDFTPQYIFVLIAGNTMSGDSGQTGKNIVVSNLAEVSFTGNNVYKYSIKNITSTSFKFNCVKRNAMQATITCNWYAFG